MKANIEPGVYDISIEQYHAGPGVSRSGVKLFMRSPLHYWHKYLNPNIKPETKPEIITSRNALDFGNAFHAFVLEKEQFAKRYIVAEKHNRVTTAGKKARTEMLQAAQGRQLLCSEAFEQIKAMAAQINASTTASALIDGALYEKSIFWRDNESGLLCKVRPDIWRKNKMSRNIIVDVKTCDDASPQAFERSIYLYGYDLQAAMIHEALHALYNINVMDFVFIAVEKEPPYAIGLYPLHENAIHKGIEDFKKASHDIKLCFDANNWPSYPDSIVNLPRYAYLNKLI
jgi:exodeoxyribonuclease VIII